MIPTRTKVVVKEGGAAVDLLLTPHLYSFKDQFGIDFSTDLKNTREVMDNYADVAFLGAVNAWVLDGKGTAEDFPYTRGDFHAWAAGAAKEFGQFVSFAIPALTGKTAAELVALKPTGKKEGEQAQDGKKKTLALDWPAIEAFLVGDLGLSEREAALCSTREYLLRSDGFTRAIRRDYELARWEVWRLMMPHFKRGQAPSEPKAYFRFGWEQMTEEEAEEKRQECAISQEDIDELNRLVNLHHERVNGNG